MYGHQDGGHRTWDMLGPGAGAGVAGRGAVNHEHVCSWNLKLGDSGGQQPGRSTASTASTVGGVEAAGSTRGGHTGTWTPAPAHLQGASCCQARGSGEGRSGMGRGAPVLAGGQQGGWWLAMRGGWCGLAGGVAGW